MPWCKLVHVSESDPEQLPSIMKLAGRPAVDLDLQGVNLRYQNKKDSQCGNQK